MLDFYLPSMFAEKSMRNLTNNSLSKKLNLTANFRRWQSTIHITYGYIWWPMSKLILRINLWNFTQLLQHQFRINQLYKSHKFLPKNSRNGNEIQTVRVEETKERPQNDLIGWCFTTSSLIGWNQLMQQIWRHIRFFYKVINLLIFV